jgi:MFS family permease
MASDSKDVVVSSAHEENSGRKTDLITGIHDSSHEHEKHVSTTENLEYTDDEHEPEIHLRTWIALLALCTQSFCQLWSLLGPPSVVSKHNLKILQLMANQNRGC